MKRTKKQTKIIALTCTVFSTLIVEAQDIKVYKAQEIKPYKAQEIKSYKAGEVKPGEKTSVNNPTSDNKNNLNYFFSLYQYWVPGTSYTLPDYTNNKEVLHNSAGTGVLPGSLKINADGTYTWNSSWEGKIIKGNWRTTGDTGYPIELLKAQEGKNWKIGKSNDKDVNIIIWDGSTWYNGKKISGR